jgi:hypothetical protein
LDIAAVREDEIYFLTKNWMLEQQFHILGGQPPNGTDRFPVIEIKSDQNTQRGSRTSFKPDLVVATNDHLLIVECKPEFDKSDVSKLREIASTEARLHAMIQEIRQRKSLERRDHNLASLKDDELIHRTRLFVAYSGNAHPVDEIYSLVFNGSGSTATLYFGHSVVKTIGN